jgi:hypothetical protein
MKDKDPVALAEIVIAHREHVVALEPHVSKKLSSDCAGGYDKKKLRLSRKRSHRRVNQSITGNEIVNTSS